MNRNTIRASLMLAAGMLLLSACGGGEPSPTGFPALLVDGKSAYLASNTLVYKFDAQTGAEAWRFPASQDTANPRGPFSGIPLKYGNVIIVGGSTNSTGGFDRHLYALSDDKGQEVWRFSPNDKAHEFMEGAISDGKLIYAPNGDGNLYAIDATQMVSSQPKLVWQFNTGNKLWSLPLLDNGKLYQGSIDHKLYAIDAATGKELWQFTGATAPIAVQPVLSDGVLYFGAFDSTFYAVNAADGTLKWKTAVDAWVWTEASIDNNTIYFGDVHGKLYALDAATGKQKWYYVTNDAIKAQPMVVSNTLYAVSEDTNAYALDLTNLKPDSTGKVDPSAYKWRNDTFGRRLVSKPTIADNAILVPLFDGDIKVWALDASNGTRKYQFPAPVSK
ncbi:MAG TPA: PQQ-binding-like beta-propeller repeat protein [Anaerolineae bacterium]